MAKLSWRTACPALLLTVLAVACGGGAGDAASARVEIDGSSTVFPVTMAVAEDFQIANPSARVTVAQSGTGGGFERFCAGETDISNASRPITANEAAICAAAGIEPLEMPVAWDGLSVVVNPGIAFAQCLTMDELRAIWMPNSQVSTWRGVRPSFPDTPISLYGPGTDSGTFDYFTEAVMGESGASRPDFQASEDDNILVRGVSGDPGALGYFGYAYYAENRDQLKLLSVDGGNGCVAPDDQTIEDRTYPLSRPIYIYVKRSALERATVRSFVEFYMQNAGTIVPVTGYHALDEADYMGNVSQLSGGG